MNALKREVGSLVRSHREQARLTQAELADKAGRSLELIGKIERGATAASFETLGALSKALKVPVAAFFHSGSYEVGEGNVVLSRIVDRLSKLDADDLEWAERLIGTALSRRVRAT